MGLQTADIFIPITDTDTLFVRRFRVEGKAIGNVFLLHGSIENGRIFYSENNKGLAPFLARNGYDVYVGDLRGRGKSKPAYQRQQ